MKNELKKLGKKYVLNADDARKLIASESLPEDWLEMALEKISELIRFNAESQSKREVTWDCTIMVNNEVCRFIPIKDKEKLALVRDIIDSRGYSVEVNQSYAGAGWTMTIKW